MKRKNDRALPVEAVTQRRVVIALKGGANSGKTGALRKLYEYMIAQGAIHLDDDNLGTKNLRRYFLAYKRWCIVICEGGDTDAIIQGNFDWADKERATVQLLSNKVDKLHAFYPSWDVIVMPAWVKPRQWDRSERKKNKEKNHNGCVCQLLKEVWSKEYALEIVGRGQVSVKKSDAEKDKSQAKCAQRLKHRIDFVLSDRFVC